MIAHAQEGMTLPTTAIFRRHFIAISAMTHCGFVLAGCSNNAGELSDTQSTAGSPESEVADWVDPLALM